jgi:LacI family transcriptional regulator
VYDVAARAGVSIATVSRVLRGNAPVAAATRDRVIAAADALSWRPSRLARAFVEQSHGAVGIVFPDLGGPYYSRVIAGFEDAAAERGWAVLILAAHGRPNADELVCDLADRVDGLVVMGSTVGDDVVESLAARRLPLVVLARPPVGDVPAVRARNTATAAALTEHVLGHDRRRLAFVGDPARSPDVNERWFGVRRAARGRADVTLIPVDGFDVEHGYKAGLDLVTGGGIDAAICANDEIAIGVINAAVTAGHTVPGSLVVTGWDDTPIAERFHPPLTTVRQPLHDLGTRAAHVLFDRVEARPAASVLLGTSVVVRQSCGCAATDATTVSTATSRRTRKGTR